MNDYMILTAGLVGGVAGGGPGAHLSKTPFRKGALLAAVASIIQFAIGELTNLRQPLVYALINLVAIGLIGGRWGMRLTARQLSLIVIGSFLLALVAATAVSYFVSSVGNL